jgi:hypothetical protein
MVAQASTQNDGTVDPWMTLIYFNECQHWIVIRPAGSRAAAIRLLASLTDISQRDCLNPGLFDCESEYHACTHAGD